MRAVKMLELRWLEISISVTDAICKTGKKLQYREKRNSDLHGVYYTEWKDVPIVSEDQNNGS
jgi:hypothetical protein